MSFLYYTTNETICQWVSVEKSKNYPKKPKNPVVVSGGHLYTPKDRCGGPQRWKKQNYAMPYRGFSLASQR